MERWRPRDGEDEGEGLRRRGRDGGRGERGGGGGERDGREVGYSSAPHAHSCIWLASHEKSPHDAYRL
jgi:hypothetical protein